MNYTSSLPQPTRPIPGATPRASPGRATAAFWAGGEAANPQVRLIWGPQPTGFPCSDLSSCGSTYRPRALPTAIRLRSWRSSESSTHSVNGWTCWALLPTLPGLLFSSLPTACFVAHGQRLSRSPNVRWRSDRLRLSRTQCMAVSKRVPRWPAPSRTVDGADHQQRHRSSLYSPALEPRTGLMNLRRAPLSIRRPTSSGEQVRRRWSKSWVAPTWSMLSATVESSTAIGVAPALNWWTVYGPLRMWPGSARCAMGTGPSGRYLPASSSRPAIPAAVGDGPRAQPDVISCRHCCGPVWPRLLPPPACCPTQPTLCNT